MCPKWTMFGVAMFNLFEGLEVDTKRCSKCQKDLPVYNFGTASGGSYIRSECRSCAAKLRISREKIKKTAPKVPADYTCPICLRTEDQVKDRGGKNNVAWVCDHDHNTEDFRGWLCHDCNRGLGNFADDTERMQRAINYLKSDDEHQ